MNNNEFTQKNDIILFKNEILGDLKKIQLKYENKVSQISEFVTSQMTIIDQKVKDITNLINNLNQKLEEKNEMEKLEQKLNKSLKNMQDLNVKLEIKYNILNKDFKDSCFRYDKIISNNLLVPGVIGDGCTYENLRPFIEYINIKISELIKSKDKHTIDNKLFKEKIENLFAQNRIKNESNNNILKEMLKQEIEKNENLCKERIAEVNTKIVNIKIENEKNINNLQNQIDEEKNKNEELKNSFNKFINEDWNNNNELIKNNINNINNINEIINNHKDEFNTIHNKLKELNDIITQIKNMKSTIASNNNIIKPINNNQNINNQNNNKNDKSPNNISNEMNKKIDMEKKTLISKNYRNEKFTQKNFDRSRNIKISNVNIISDLFEPKDTQDKFKIIFNNNEYHKKIGLNITLNNRKRVFKNNNNDNNIVLNNSALDVIDNKELIKTNSYIFKDINYNRLIKNNRKLNNKKIKIYNFNGNNFENYSIDNKLRRNHKIDVPENVKLNNLSLAQEFGKNELNYVNKTKYNLRQAYKIAKSRLEEQQRIKNNNIFSNKSLSGHNSVKSMIPIKFNISLKNKNILKQMASKNNSLDDLSNLDPNFPSIFPNMNNNILMNNLSYLNDNNNINNKNNFLLKNRNKTQIENNLMIDNDNNNDKYKINRSNDDEMHHDLSYDKENAKESLNRIKSYLIKKFKEDII